MFYTNEEVIGKRASLKQDYWTEKGVYLRGHTMKIKKLEGYLTTLEDDNGELFVPLGCLDVLEEQKPITEEEVEAAWKTTEREYWEHLARKQGQLQETKSCHGTQACPGFQESVLAVTHGSLRGHCRHRSPLDECRRSDYQKDMEAWRKCQKSST